MNKHEDDVLRKMIHQLRTYRNGIHGEFFLEVAAKLENLGFINDAPDDGLREGLEAILATRREEIKRLVNTGYFWHATLQQKDIADISALLAKTPDPWKPIADAPRDGRWLIVTNAEDEEEEAPLDLIHWCKVLEKWQDWTGYVYKNTNLAGVFTHYREKPAPPREGKECE